MSRRPRQQKNSPKVITPRTSDVKDNDTDIANFVERTMQKQIANYQNVLRETRTQIITKKLEYLDGLTSSAGEGMHLSDTVNQAMTALKNEYQNEDYTSKINVNMDELFHLIDIEMNQINDHSNFSTLISGVNREFEREVRHTCTLYYNKIYCPLNLYYMASRLRKRRENASRQMSLYIRRFPSCFSERLYSCPS